MMKFKTIAIAAALALAVPGLAMAATPPKPAAAPAGHVQAQPAKASYDQVHKGVLDMITRYRDSLTNGENGARLSQLPAEVGKLPDLEKAYLDAKNAGKEADARAAADSYVQQVQHVIDLALPLDNLVSATEEKIGTILGQMGPVGEKLLAEKDIVALQADIAKTLKPLDNANDQVGTLHDRAEASAKVRASLAVKQFYTEELGNQVTNYLQGKIGR